MNNFYFLTTTKQLQTLIKCKREGGRKLKESMGRATVASSFILYCNIKFVQIIIHHIIITLMDNNNIRISWVHACTRVSATRAIHALLINIASSRAQARGTRCLLDYRENSAIFPEQRLSRAKNQREILPTEDPILFSAGNSGTHVGIRFSLEIPPFVSRRRNMRLHMHT